MLTGYADLPVAEEPVQPRQPLFETAAYKGETIRAVTVSRRLAAQGAPVAVQVSVAQTRTGQAALLEQLFRSALFLGVGFFVLASGLAVWAAQSSITPLRSLTEAISRRGPKDLRPVTRPVPAEMSAAGLVAQQLHPPLAGLAGPVRGFHRRGRAPGAHAAGDGARPG